MTWPSPLTPEVKRMIYLAHGDDARRKVIAATLELLSHEVKLSTAVPSELIQRCRENLPDVAIVGSDFAGEDAFEVLNELSRQNVCPVVALLKSEDVDRSRRLMNDQVMGVLVEPANESDLRTSIYLARRRFYQSRRMKDRIAELEDELRQGDESESHS